MTFRSINRATTKKKNIHYLMGSIMWKEQYNNKTYSWTKQNIKKF